MWHYINIYQIATSTDNTKGWLDNMTIMCRGGSSLAGKWDGSFGSPTNPRPGGEQSDWIKKNAKSGSARNEEYYGKVAPLVDCPYNFSPSDRRRQQEGPCQVQEGEPNIL